MAKLHARPVIEEIDEASDPTRFDNDLEKLLIAHSNNPEELLRTVVGFVDRTTRFFKQSDASKKLAKLVDGASPATSSGKGVKGGFSGKATERDTSAASKVKDFTLPCCQCCTPNFLYYLLVTGECWSSSKCPSSSCS